MKIAANVGAIGFFVSGADADADSDAAIVVPFSLLLAPFPFPFPFSLEGVLFSVDSGGGEGGERSGNSAFEIQVVVIKVRRWRCR